MGISNEPGTLQRTMHAVLAGLEALGVPVYMYDILVATTGYLEHHLSVLEEVLNRLFKDGLWLRLAKCNFAHRETQFVGHLVSGKGMRVDPKKVASMKSFPNPSSRKGLHKALGLFNYYRI